MASLFPPERFASRFGARAASSADPAASRASQSIGHGWSLLLALFCKSVSSWVVGKYLFTGLNGARDLLPGRLDLMG
jgi:hypothetical protein